jgi:Nickel responsive protein SCO4226-like
MRSPAAPAYGHHVTLFLVFRNLPGVTRDQYTAAQRAASDASRRSSQAGREVSYLGGFFLTGAGRAICIFQAESAADVTAVNKQAGVPATDIAEAIDLRAAT